MPKISCDGRTDPGTMRTAREVGHSKGRSPAVLPGDPHSGAPEDPRVAFSSAWASTFDETPASLWTETTTCGLLSG